MEKAIAQVQDTLTVMANIQARQAEVLKQHSQWLVDNESWMTRMREAQEQHESRMAEIEEKLNALIQIVDGIVKRGGKS